MASPAEYFLSGRFICLCRDSDAAEPEQPAAETRPRLDDTEPPPMLIHRVHDQEADEVMPARRLELVAKGRLDSDRAGKARAGKARAERAWLVAQLPTVGIRGADARRGSSA
jgi:hypothetical protein